MTRWKSILRAPARSLARISGRIDYGKSYGQHVRAPNGNIDRAAFCSILIAPQLGLFLEYVLEIFLILLRFNRIRTLLLFGLQLVFCSLELVNCLR